MASSSNGMEKNLAANPSVEHLRDTAAARVENTSLRSVAREIGMSPTGLKKFLLGTAPYSPTLRRLRNWYVEVQSKEPGAVTTLEGAAAAVNLLVRDLPEREQREVVAGIVEAITDGYIAAAKQGPLWLGEMLALYSLEG